MRPVLFVIPKFSLPVYAALVLFQILLFFLVFFLLRKRSGSVKKLKSDLSGYFIFVFIITTLLFLFGPFPLRTYGVAVAAGFVVSLAVAGRLAQKSGMDQASFYDLGMYILAGVIIGSRLFYVVLYDWSFFIQNPLSIFALWEGGLVFYGGLVGGILLALYYVRKKNLDTLKVADICGTVLPLGYFFGRLGCLGYGCCFGKAASSGFPLAIRFPAVGHPLTGPTPAFSEHLHRGLIDAGSVCSAPVYPTQLIESISGLLLFCLLLFLYNRNRRSGRIAGLFLVFYSLLRFIIEFIRVEPRFLGITASQWISFLTLAFGVWLYAYSRRKAPE